MPYESKPLHVSNISRISAGLGFLVLSYQGVFSTSKRDGTAAELYAPIAHVVLSWVCLFFFFLFHQAYTHICVFVGRVRLAKKDGTNARVELHEVKRGAYGDSEVVVVNTTVRNTMEQSLIFLPLLWMCAILGGEDGIAHAKLCGYLWLFSRVYYPIVYEMSSQGRSLPLLFLSTVPGYIAQTGLLLQTLRGLGKV